MANGGYYQDLDKKLTEKRQKELIQAGIKSTGDLAQRVSLAGGGAGNIESPAGAGGGGGKLIADAAKRVGKSFLAVDKGNPPEWSRPPESPQIDVKSNIGVAHGEGFASGPKAPTETTNLQDRGGWRQKVPPTSDTWKRPSSRESTTSMTYEATPGTGGEVRKGLGDYWRNLGSTPEPLGHIASKAKQNMIAKSQNPNDLTYQATPEGSKSRLDVYGPRFGPAQRTGGRDVMDVAGNVIESSDWLKEGNAFSSNAWQKTVGGQPNQGYDPNAVQPAGYYNEAGTFIAGPRFKPADLEGMISRATKGLKDENAIAAVTSALSNAMSGITGVVPEGTGIGPEKERGLKERMAKIAAEASKATASITAAGGVQEAGIGAGADKYRSDTPYYQETTTQKTPTPQWKQDAEGNWYNESAQASPGGQAVSKDRVRVIQNQLRDLKGKDRDDYLDSLTPEEFNAVKGSR